MAMSMRPRALKVDVPTLEPDAVMLDRLVALSAGSTPSRGTSRSVGLRVAFVATVVASLGATTWAAGAIPGVEAPLQHRVIEHEPLVPTTQDRSVGSPQSDDSASGSPTAVGLPDNPAPDAPASVVLPQGIVLPTPASQTGSGKVPPGQAKPDHATKHPTASQGKGKAKGHAKPRHHAVKHHPAKHPAKHHAKKHHAKKHRPQPRQLPRHPLLKAHARAAHRHH
jgi:hypothetical protein